MPAALDVGAKALGVTTQEFLKMMEQGQILAKDFWPKFFKEYRKITDPALIKATKSFAASQERFINTFNRFKKNLFRTGLEKVFTQILQAIESIILTLDRAVRSGLGEFIGGFVEGFTFLVRLVAAAADDLSFHISKWLGKSNEEAKDFNNTLIELAGTLAGIVASFMVIRKFSGKGKGAGGGKSAKSAAIRGGLATAVASAPGPLKVLAGGVLLAHLVGPDIRKQALAPRHERRATFARSGLDFTEGFKSALFRERTSPRRNRRITAQKMRVEVDVKDSEFSKAINVRVQEAADTRERDMITEISNSLPAD